jgi:ppGpp synthetase/RelA/SpoT-type nucleotidyltranferase
MHHMLAQAVIGYCELSMHSEKQYSKNHVDKAGAILAQPNVAERSPEDFAQAMQVLSFWRSLHENPLEDAVELSRRVASACDARVVMAKRLKRTSSIMRKLVRMPDMKLSRMQDIGGCRAIVSTNKKVGKVVRDLKKKKDFRIKDYQQKPKDDGYRSVHLIGKFRDDNGNKREIEIQIRSAAQHAWATSVEIIDLFTGQAIKANMGLPDWRAFFLAASEQIQLIETISFYNQLSHDALASEIYDRLAYDRLRHASQRTVDNLIKLEELERKLGILRRFSGFAASLQAADDHMAEQQTSGYVLLSIDTELQEVDVKLFAEDQFATGNSMYLQAEMASASQPHISVALVSSDAVGGIKEAYPNYFADSSEFVKYMSASVEAIRHYNPNKVGRAIRKLFQS